MPTLLLIRHGRTAANADGILAGRTPGVILDEKGREQAATLAGHLAPLPLVRVIASPLERTVQTAQALLDTGGTKQVPRPVLLPEPQILECDYGTWAGQPIKTLLREPLWKTVQAQPSAVVFPGGESMLTMANRAVEAVRRHDRQVADEFGPHAVWAAVSHGDIIKAVLADALGSHLDAFQRIVVDPCSVSVVRYGDTRPFVLSMNGQGQGLESLAATSRRRRKPPSDAVVGGGAGPG